MNRSCLPQWESSQLPFILLHSSYSSVTFKWPVLTSLLWYRMLRLLQYSNSAKPFQLYVENHTPPLTNSRVSSDENPPPVYVHHQAFSSVLSVMHTFVISLFELYDHPSWQEIHFILTSPALRLNITLIIFVDGEINKDLDDKYSQPLNRNMLFNIRVE